MEDKNTIIINYCNTLFGMASSLVNLVNGLTNDNIEVNMGIIASADVQTTAIRSQLVLIQNALDNYKGDGV